MINTVIINHCLAHNSQRVPKKKLHLTLRRKSLLISDNINISSSDTYIKAFDSFFSHPKTTTRDEKIPQPWK